MSLVTNWITKLPRLKNAKVARFSYKAEAYANDDIEGVENYDYSRDMNIPLATHTDFDGSVLSTGARANFSSIPKNGLNHFFGRVSYNLNKVIDFLSDFLDDFISFTEIISFSSSATLATYADGTTKRLLSTADSDITITLPEGETYLGSDTITLTPSIMLTITKRGTVWINSSGNAATADKWKTARTITISDADGTNTGTAVSVDGSDNETLKLPPTIKANITGNADTATIATQATQATQANVRVSLRHGTTFFSKTWAGLTDFRGSNIWTDGENIYYSFSAAQYVLNKSTSTWTAKTWNVLTSFYGEQVWTDGDTFYFSNGAAQYVLNKSTSTWTAKTWNVLTSFYGEQVWTDGDTFYFSNGAAQYVLNKVTSTWNVKTWLGLTNFSGNNVWTDGGDIYYSSGTTQFVLNKATSTWSVKTWTGLTDFIGSNILTDGDNIYHSDGTTQNVLNKATSTWSSKTWAGLTDFRGSNIWTDGDNIYYSFGAEQYVLPATRHNYVDDDKYNSLFGTVTKCKRNTLSARFVFSNE